MQRPWGAVCPGGLRSSKEAMWLELWRKGRAIGDSDRGTEGGGWDPADHAGLYSHCRDFGFYSERNEKLLGRPEQRNHKI